MPAFAFLETTMDRHLTMTISINAAFSLSIPEASELPQDIQYMPPGTHRIYASRNGEPVSLEIIVNAATAETLNAFLQAQLAKSKEGSDDRPFFDLSHEDCEAATWLTEFYWSASPIASRSPCASPSFAPPSPSFRAERRD